MSAFTPLTLNSNKLTVQILPHGAALVGVYLTGRDQNLVLGFADPQDHARIPVYAGSIVGPIANRISGGSVDIEGASHLMPRNEAHLNTLHSGPQGLHSKAWQVTSHRADEISLRATLEDGACGLPGNRVITAKYQVADDTLSLTLEATTDRATAINLAPHAYWNLDAQPDISGHHLQISADSYLPTDVANLPTGAVQPVRGTVFDFTTARPVPLTPALDVNYCLSDRPTSRPRAAATLTGADGTQLALATNAPGLQVYNGAFLPDLAGVLAGNRPLRRYHAIALEPQFWPDAPRNPGFPQITLYPNQTWCQVTQYRIKAAN